MQSHVSGRGLGGGVGLQALGGKPPTADEFSLARAGQEQRLEGKDRLGRQRVQRQSRYVNLCKGTLWHSRDGEGFVLHNKGTRKRPELLLLNATGQEQESRAEAERLADGAGSDPGEHPGHARRATGAKPRSA